jgi:DNA-binding winged helix-turn-helix (wHTH) protein
MIIGRRADCDIVIDDPYASRRHCTLEVQDAQVLVDARGALNQVTVRGRLVDAAYLRDGQSFTVGDTQFRVRRTGLLADDRTLKRERSPAEGLILRLSTREITEPDGTLLARLSEAECRILAVLARRHPDAASHEELAEAVWEGRGYDRYLIHRLVQRVRQRLGAEAGGIESVRGSGYRVKNPIRLV